MPWADLLAAWRQVALYEHDYMYPTCAEIARRDGLYPLVRLFDRLGVTSDRQVNWIYRLLVGRFPRPVDPVYLHGILSGCYFASCYGSYSRLIQVIAREQRKQRALLAASF
jgi:hypothetical protein